MKTPKIKVVTISAFLFISFSIVSVEARDRHSERHDEEVEIEHIIIKKEKHRSPSHHYHEGPPHHHEGPPHHHHRIHRHLPDGYRTIKVIDRHYYYHDNTYYRKCRGGYEIVSTPRVRHLPRHSRKIIINRSTYYIYDDVYYRFQDDYYVVCKPPKPRHRHKSPSIRFNIDVDIK
jgi:hypothetical protein